MSASWMVAAGGF